MLGRLANVIYWISLGLGALLEIYGWALIIFGPSGQGYGAIGGFVIVTGFVVVGIGRACLYVLAGR